MSSSLIATENFPTQKRRVSVILPCYNYARFLDEALQSILSQTRLPDEILISDDASTDDTFELARELAKHAPEKIRLNRNAENMGIVAHFNKAVAMTSGDLICFLGADNRCQPNYLEACAQILESDENIAIAYTDFALFGVRAEMVFQQFRKDFPGEPVGDFWHINFPEYSAEAKQQLLHGANFIHGSAMYRRAAYAQVSGYAARTKRAEDHGMFARMIEAGWSARKANGTLLEYRQHSTEQDSIQLTERLNAQKLQTKLEKLEARLLKKTGEAQRLRERLTASESELKRLKSAWPIRLLRRYGVGK